MSLIPMLCDGCLRLSLQSLQLIAEQTPECPDCHEALRVIPSCSYSPSDIDIFGDLTQTIGTTLSAPEAYRFSLDVENALASGIMHRIFEPLVLRWPGLVPNLVVVGTNLSRQRRSLQMLKTIFEALSTTRRSGTMPRVDGTCATSGAQRAASR